MISNVVLTIGFGWLAWLSWRHVKPEGKVTALVAVLFLTSYISPIAVKLFSLEISNIYLIHNAMHYIGLPLAILLLLRHCYAWHWQAATWGRLFLGLAVVFELMRRNDLSQDYLALLLVLWLGLLLVSLLFFTKRHNQLQKVTLFASAALIIGWFIAKQSLAISELTTQIYVGVWWVLMSLVGCKPSHNR